MALSHELARAARARRSARVLGILALSLAAPALAPGSALAQPRIDFGRHFQVRLHHQTNSAEEPPVGQSRLYVAATVLGARGDLTITVSQRGRGLISVLCPIVGGGRRTNCASDWIDAERLDPARDAEVKIVSVDSVSDAESVLYEATLPVYRFSDWAGNRDGRPRHVEQRAFRVDSALGIAFATQAAFGTSVDGSGSETVTESWVFFRYWDARDRQGENRLTMRCRVGEGEWQGMRLSGPGTDGDDQRVVNRVWGADGRVHDGEGESVYYQQWQVSVAFPFIVPGAEKRLSSPPAAANGHWTCELRNPERQVVRRFEFDVRENELVPHPAARELTLEPGTGVVAVGFSADALPVSFDPAEVRRGFFGRPWSSPEVAPVVGELPSRPVTPRFTAPAGSRGGRGRRR
jgi:hypothetical protein